MNQLFQQHVENEIDFRSSHLSVWRPVAAGIPFIKDYNPYHLLITRVVTLAK